MYNCRWQWVTERVGLININKLCLQNELQLKRLKHYFRSVKFYLLRPFNVGCPGSQPGSPAAINSLYTAQYSPVRVWIVGVQGGCMHLLFVCEPMFPNRLIHLSLVLFLVALNWLTCRRKTKSYNSLSWIADWRMWAHVLMGTAFCQAENFLYFVVLQTALSSLRAFTLCGFCTCLPTLPTPVFMPMTPN